MIKYFLLEIELNRSAVVFPRAQDNAFFLASTMIQNHHDCCSTQISTFFLFLRKSLSTKDFNRIPIAQKRDVFFNQFLQV